MNSAVIFDPVVVGWEGKDYKIPPFRVLGAIARVEEHLTLSNLQHMVTTGNIPLARVAAAYASVLQFAGLRITGDEVYGGILAGNGTVNSETALMLVQGLLMMMLPKSAKRQIEDALASTAEPTEGDSGNSQASDSPPRTVTKRRGPSKSSTKRSSARQKPAVA
jgi:hypothetical protein